MRRPVRTAEAERSRSRDDGGVAWTRSSSSRTMRRSRSRLGGLRSTGIAGRLAATGLAAARTTTLRAGFAIFALTALAALAAGALTEAARDRACFEALTAVRLPVALRRETCARAVFFVFLAVFAAALRFALVRLRVAAFLTVARLRPAVFRPAAFLARAAGRRRVAAFRFAMRRPFKGRNLP